MFFMGSEWQSSLLCTVSCEHLHRELQDDPARHLPHVHARHHLLEMVLPSIWGGLVHLPVSLYSKNPLKHYKRSNLVHGVHSCTGGRALKLLLWQCVPPYHSQIPGIMLKGGLLR